MKAILILSFVLVGAPLAFSHEGHDHEKEEHHHEEEAKKGPNGGRIIASVTPHFELVVTKERKVKITFLDEEGAAIAPTEQVITAVSGQRANPTRLAFAKGEEDESGSLVSDLPLPDGEHVPLVLQIKTTPDEKTVTERLTLHLHD